MNALPNDCNLPVYAPRAGYASSVNVVDMRTSLMEDDSGRFPLDRVRRQSLGTLGLPFLLFLFLVRSARYTQRMVFALVFWFGSLMDLVSDPSPVILCLAFSLMLFLHDRLGLSPRAVYNNACFSAMCSLLD